MDVFLQEKNSLSRARKKRVPLLTFYYERSPVGSCRMPRITIPRK